MTGATELGAMRAGLNAANIECVGNLVNVALSLVECSAEDEQVNLQLLERLEGCDDVDTVEHNMNRAGR